MPPTLGQRLKHAREKRGLSLRDLEHTTRIPAARLQDLEEDKLNTFGGMAYAKGHLRTYAAILEVDAEEVLNRIHPPPLGGVRDYRYLVESQGQWISDRRERPAPLAPSSTLDAGKSFLFAAMLSVGIALLIGGAVLARAYFVGKSSGGQVTQGTENAGSISTGTAADSSNTSGGAYLTADQVKQEQEFGVSNVSVTVAPDQVLKAIPVTVPPKAQPVLEPRDRASAVPPKAQPVR